MTPVLLLLIGCKEPLGSDTSEPSEPQADEFYDGGVILDAYERGELREGEAALALWSLWAGLPVEPGLLEPTEEGDDGRVHLFLREVSLRMDELPDEDRLALEEFFETIEPEDARRSDSGDWCHWADADMAGHAKVYVQCEDGQTNSAAMAALVTETAAIVQTNFESIFGHSVGPGSRIIQIWDSTPANWDSGVSGYAYQNDEDICRIHVTAAPGPWSDALFLSAEDQVRGTLIHELFHCAQFTEGYTSTGGPWWLIEGTAMWSEDYEGDQFWPGMDTEHSQLDNFFDPLGIHPFLDRRHDAVNPLMQLSEAADPELGFTLIQAGDPLDELVNTGDFATVWHTASVSTWNEEPVEPYLNDGRSIEGDAQTGAPGDLPFEDLEDYEVPSLAPLSYDLFWFEVASNVEVVGVELTVLPETFRASGLVDGPDDGEVQPLVLNEKVYFCRKAVGACHEEEDRLYDFDQLGLVTTNTGPEDSDASTAHLDSYSPQLQGTWRTVAMYSSTQAEPIQWGSIVTIHEEDGEDTFSETLSGASVYSQNFYNCTVTGSVQGNIHSDYLSTDGPSATGILDVSLTSGDPPTQTCYDSEGQFVFSGAVPGMWLFQSLSPWASSSWSMVEDQLTIVTPPEDGVYFTVVLQRIS